MTPSPARSLAAALALCALALAATPLAQPAQPQPPAQPAAATAVEVRVGETTTVPLPRAPMIIGAEDESVARVTVLSDGRAAITGVSVGQTRVIGRDFAQVPIIFPVVVTAARR